MFYLENYGPYSSIIQNKCMIVESTSINNETWFSHYNCILNIMKDGIETEYMREVFITLRFKEIDVDLTIPDYYFNLMMWNIIVKSGLEIRPKHIIFEPGITRKVIKKFIDTNFIKVCRKHLENITMNNLIDDCMYNFRDIDLFSFFLANTINLEDFIDLMKKYPEFNDLIHADLSNVPLDEVKKVGMDLANRSIDYIKNSDHCLANFFIANEGVNPKQYKEFAINIGTKPDGRGGVYPVAINTNFIIGGVNDILSYMVESSTGRTAQIIVEGNVGISGNFARLLGLNNLDTIIHPDPNYICDTKNYQEVNITDENILTVFDGRYYRFIPNGMEYVIDSDKDRHLIGQTLLVRSPMTCASLARGEGVCHRCYGDLINTNKDINIGKIAAELISSELTQMMLSAKHLLESAMRKIIWNSQFKDLFEIEYNVIKLQDEIDFSGYKLIIDPEGMDLDVEDDGGLDLEFNEHIFTFDIMYPNGEIVNFHTSSLEKLYIAGDLNECIRMYGERVDDKIYVDMNKIKNEEASLFAIQLQNNDLSRLLNKINNILNKVPVTTKMNRNELLHELNHSLKEGGMHVNSIHNEIILANQLRNKYDILAKPEWEYANEECSILTLNQALNNNPSISISLAYAKISKALYSPLTYRKNKPSFMDLFFMEQPQLYLSNNDTIVKVDKTKYTNNGLKQVMFYVDKKTVEEEEV